MPKLDQERVQKAIDRAFDSEVANLFKAFIENMIETGATGGDFTKAERCVTVFSDAI